MSITTLETDERCDTCEWPDTCAQDRTCWHEERAQPWTRPLVELDTNGRKTGKPFAEQKA